MKTVSVIMATFNSGPVLEQCLASIRNQNYDQKKIEIVVADGGSTDGTLTVIKKYGGKIIPEKTGSPEAAKAIALKHARGEIILQIDSDNILPDKNWLSLMVSFFDQEPKITGCYPWRYTYQKKDKPLNRYFSLLGANDPVAWFLGRTDRQSYLSSQWCLAGKAKDKGNYFLVEFTPENLPTVGANGFLIRRKLLLKANVQPEYFFHIDVNLDLVRQGYRRYLVVKNDIIHQSGEGFWQFFQKRKRYFYHLFLENHSHRRYFIYRPPQDIPKIILYSLYSLTLIGPLFWALKGYRKIRDPAWFLHPLVCLLIFLIYSSTFIYHRLLLLKRKTKELFSLFLSK